MSTIAVRGVEAVVTITAFTVPEAFRTKLFMVAFELWLVAFEWWAIDEWFGRGFEAL